MIAKLARHTIHAGLALAAFLSWSNSAIAESSWEKVYQVQVEYWFFDTDYYYWQTYYESTNYGAANFVYVILQGAKQNGTLQAAAPNAYWRYIPVDVRFVVKFRPKYQLSEQAYGLHESRGLTPIQ